MVHQDQFSLGKFFLFSLCCFVLGSKTYGQAAIEAWGNMKGIQTDGELMRFETGIDVIGAGWSGISSTGKERQRPKYRRDANTQTVTTRIDSFYLVQTLEDLDKGIARVHIQVTSKKDTSLAGVYFHLKLPLADYGNGSMQFTAAQQKTLPAYTIATKTKDLAVMASAVTFKSAERQLQISFSGTVNLLVKKLAGKNGAYLHLFIPLIEGNVKNGQLGDQTFTVKASGSIDRSPATVQLNTAAAGPVFAGFGGNFRLQNAKTDPPVIDYCLEHLRVAWSRVEMPWQLWQPEKNTNPIDTAKAGRLNAHVQKSMEMAQRLYKKGIPVILTAWSAPKWAVSGNISYGPRADGVWGNPLDTTSTKEIYQSIADYIIYLRDVYGVEIKLFSFNESDLGINIRQTGEEHAALIKGLGAYFVSRGLKTKMLLGDNSDATTWAFIYPALKDAATHPYIGAVSFHSWRGWDTATLQQWRDAASQLKLPLIVGEGSIDAAAWNYPLIFEEPVYAMEEINLYVRLLAICQPLSILQWQLTADYSPLSGGGIFGNNEPLRPTQRFWNLQQLASVPENVQAIPATIDKPNISCAAQGNRATDKYAVHLVNNGAARKIIIKGLPRQVKLLQQFVTNRTLHHQQTATVKVINGIAAVPIAEQSYITLLSE